MMTSNQLGESNELARRFMACGGWRLTPGMRLLVTGTDCAVRLVSSADRSRVLVAHEDDKEGQREDGEVVPDLSDAATIGCILGLVREAWGDPDAGLFMFGQKWDVIVPNKCEDIFGATQAEALLAALEAAP